MGPQTQAAKEAQQKEKKDAQIKETNQSVRDLNKGARNVEREITKL